VHELTKTLFAMPAKTSFLWARVASIIFLLFTVFMTLATFVTGSMAISSVQYRLTEPVIEGQPIVYTPFALMMQDIFPLIHSLFYLALAYYLFRVFWRTSQGALFDHQAIRRSWILALLCGAYAVLNVIELLFTEYNFDYFTAHEIGQTRTTMAFFAFLMFLLFFFLHKVLIQGREWEEDHQLTI
jgi:hypothetical protein